ncbi:MAG: 50S ribosomal protein L9 [Thermoleophilia bacterium]
MEIILLEDIEGVGQKGDLANVSRGYARNYLLPKRLAEVANPGRLDEVRRLMEERKAREARTADQAVTVAATLNKTVVTIGAHAGEGERLYGSVTNADIADAIWSARKVRVDKHKVRLDEPIKSVGTFMVDIDVFEGVEASVKVIVVPE